MRTHDLEYKLFNTIKKLGTYICFEVKMPDKRGERGRYIEHNMERVDCLSLDTKGVWRFYELKVSVADFHSKNKCTFWGHLNYYVMPREVYEKVKEEVPNHVGVFVGTDASPKLTCVKKAKRQELRVDHDALFFSFMQALSRETAKHIAVTHTQAVTETNRMVSKNNS